MRDILELTLKEIKGMNYSNCLDLQSNEDKIQL